MGWRSYAAAPLVVGSRVTGVIHAKDFGGHWVSDTDLNFTVALTGSGVETTITAVHFEDGAKVAENDLLFTLDSRQIDAQIEQAEGTLAKDQAQLEGALRALRRYTDLVGKGANLVARRNADRRP